MALHVICVSIKASNMYSQSRACNYNIGIFVPTLRTQIKSFAVYACYNNIMILYPYMQLQMGSPVECLETVKNCMLQTQCQGMLNLPCGLSKQCMYTTLIHVFTHMAQTLQCYKTRGRRAHENNPAVHNMGIALSSLL